jgi:hypothetical protein
MASIANTLERPGSLLDRAEAGTAGANVAPVAQPRRGMRLIGHLTAVVLATALVLPLAESTQTAEAGKKKTLVTRTFSSSGQIEIPDAGSSGPGEPYPSTIVVDAFGKYKKARIKDVNLTLRGFSHSFPDHVDVMLALGNRRVTVMSDVGGNTDANALHITLDDQAAPGLPGAFALEAGTFRPSNRQGTGEADPADDPFSVPAPAPTTNFALSTFKNAKPDGPWRLFVHDDSVFDTSELASGWKLEITAKVKKKKK